MNTNITLNEAITQSISDSVYCELVDMGIDETSAYDMSRENFDPIEIMANVNLESALF